MFQLPTLNSKNGFEYTPAIREYAESKAREHAEKFEEYVSSGNITLTVERDKHICKITMNMVGLPAIHVESTKSDMYQSIDEACDKMERALRKCKEKHTRTKGGDTIRRHDEPVEDMVEDEE